MFLDADIYWFLSPGLDDDKSEREDTESSQSESEGDQTSVTSGRREIAPPDETNYVVNRSEELGQVSIWL